VATTLPRSTGPTKGRSHHPFSFNYRSNGSHVPQVAVKTNRKRQALSSSAVEQRISSSRRYKLFRNCCVSALHTGVAVPRGFPHWTQTAVESLAGVRQIITTSQCGTPVTFNRCLMPDVHLSIHLNALQAVFMRAGKITINMVSTVACINAQLARFRRHRYSAVSTAPSVPGTISAVDRLYSRTCATVKKTHTIAADNHCLPVRNVSSSMAKLR
jgi:hypothetical protein